MKLGFFFLVWDDTVQRTRWQSYLGTWQLKRAGPSGNMHCVPITVGHRGCSKNTFREKRNWMRPAIRWGKTLCCLICSNSYNSYSWRRYMYTNSHDLYTLHQRNVHVCVCVSCWYEVACCVVLVCGGVEIVWHMHHRGDSVSEGGSQAGGRKRSESALEWRQEKEKKEKRREGQCIAEIRSAPFSQPHSNEIKRSSLSDVK